MILWYIRWNFIHPDWKPLAWIAGSVGKEIYMPNRTFPPLSVEVSSKKHGRSPIKSTETPLKRTKGIISTSFGSLTACLLCQPHFFGMGWDEEEELKYFIFLQRGIAQYRKVFCFILLCFLLKRTYFTMLFNSIFPTTTASGVISTQLPGDRTKCLNLMQEVVQLFPENRASECVSYSHKERRMLFMICCDSLNNKGIQSNWVHTGGSNTFFTH